jgi:hypothetical protein
MAHLQKDTETVTGQETGFSSRACPKCGTPGGAEITHVCMTAGVPSHVPLPDLPEAVMVHYSELLDAERRATALQEFIAYTLDEFGERMSSQWKAHARSLLAD